MRTSCLFCVRKHLSKALVLMSECKLGYPQHRDLVIGNMSEAEDECVKKYPTLAQAIRAERLKYEKDASYCPRIESLLGLVKKHFPKGMSGVDVETASSWFKWLTIGGIVTMLALKLRNS